jgi:hypothetical protein
MFETFDLLPQKDRIKVVDQALADYIKYAGVLEERLDKGDHQNKCYAAYLLGWYRINESIVLLNRHLTLYDAERPDLRMWYWGEYPVVEALIRIGHPAVKTMMANIASSNEPLVLRLSTRVLFHVLGEYWAKEYLKVEISKSRETTAKEKFERALKEIEDQTFRLPLLTPGK